MKKPNDLEHQIKQQLNDSIEALPESVLQKLALARKQALLAASGESVNKLKPHKSHTFSRQAIWAVAASICIMLPLWFVMSPVTEDSGIASSAAKNFDTLDMMSTLAKLDEDEIEILQELEFVLWLNKQDSFDLHSAESTERG